MLEPKVLVAVSIFISSGSFPLELAKYKSGIDFYLYFFFILIDELAI